MLADVKYRMTIIEYDKTMEIAKLLQVSLHNALDDSANSLNALPDNNDECPFKSISFKSFVHALLNDQISTRMFHSNGNIVDASHTYAYTCIAFL